MELPGGVADSGPTMSKEILPKAWLEVSVWVTGCCVFTRMDFCNWQLETILQLYLSLFRLFVSDIPLHLRKAET